MKFDAHLAYSANSPVTRFYGVGYYKCHAGDTWHHTPYMSCTKIQFGTWDDGHFRPHYQVFFLVSDFIL